MISYSIKPRRLPVMRAALVLLLGCVATVAQAQPSVFAKFGYANANFALDAPYNGVIDDGSFSYGASVGFDFGEYMGAEAEWMGYGDFDGRATPCPIGEACAEVIQDTGDNRIRTMTLSLVPHTTVGRAELFGRAGYYRARIDAETSIGGSDFTQRGVVLGAGFRWDVNDKPWSFSLEASRFDDNIYRLTFGLGWKPSFGAD